MKEEWRAAPSSSLRRTNLSIARLPSSRQSISYFRSSIKLSYSPLEKQGLFKSFSLSFFSTKKAKTFFVSIFLLTSDDFFQLDVWCLLVEISSSLIGSFFNELMLFYYLFYRFFSILLRNIDRFFSCIGLILSLNFSSKSTLFEILE